MLQLGARAQRRLPPSRPPSPSQEPLRARESSSSSSKMADRPVPVKEMRLLDVKLGQLPQWFTSREYSLPAFVRACKRAHDGYFNKYCYVKKAGIGGYALFITGYVILSYIWTFDHIKHDRWRKYH